MTYWDAICQAVECSRCGAAIGARCRTRAGNARKSYHVDRCNEAVRVGGAKAEGGNP